MTTTLLSVKVDDDALVHIDTIAVLMRSSRSEVVRTVLQNALAEYADVAAACLSERCEDGEEKS